MLDVAATKTNKWPTMEISILSFQRKRKHFDELLYLDKTSLLPIKNLKRYLFSEKIFTYRKQPKWR